MSDTRKSRSTTAPTALHRHELEVWIRAIREHVPGLRALLAEQAMRVDFDLDFIDDVRLALDEVCALALANCTPDDVVTVRLQVASSQVRIEASVPTGQSEPRGNGLSLRVLESLADSLTHGIDDTGAERIFRIGFCRSRRPSPWAAGFGRALR